MSVYSPKGAKGLLTIGECGVMLIMGIGWDCWWCRLLVCGVVWCELAVGGVVCCRLPVCGIEW